MTAVRWLLLPDWQGAGLADAGANAGAPGPGARLLGGLQHSGAGQPVLQDDWFWPRRGDWMVCLDEAVLQAHGPLALVALGLGCHLVAAWAAHSRQASRIAMALLLDPPDTAAEDAPPQWASWRRIVRQALPFPARVLSIAPTAQTAPMALAGPTAATAATLTTDGALALASGANFAQQLAQAWGADHGWLPDEPDPDADADASAESPAQRWSQRAQALLAAARQPRGDAASQAHGLGASP